MPTCAVASFNSAGFNRGADNPLSVLAVRQGEDFIALGKRYVYHDWHSFFSMKRTPGGISTSISLNHTNAVDICPDVCAHTNLF